MKRKTMTRESITFKDIKEHITETDEILHDVITQVRQLQDRADEENNKLSIATDAMTFAELDILKKTNNRQKKTNTCLVITIAVLATIIGLILHG